METIADKVYTKLHRDGKNTIAHYVRCLGVKFPDDGNINDYVSEFKEGINLNYTRLLSAIRASNSPNSALVISELEYLSAKLSVMFLNPENTEGVALRAMHCAHYTYSVASLRTALDLFTLTQMNKLRDMPTNYFKLLSAELYLQQETNVIKCRTVAELPVAKLAKSTLTEVAVVLSKGTLYSAGESIAQHKTVFTYTNIMQLNLALHRLSVSISRSRNQKDLKQHMGYAVSDLVSRAKLKPMDILIFPDGLAGSMLRGSLTVKYSLLGKSIEEEIPLTNLVGTEENLRVYKSTLSLNTPVGKREVYLMYAL